jgi:hypothetical protein
LVRGDKVKSFDDRSSANYAVSRIFRVAYGKLERLHANSSCNGQNRESALHISEEVLQVWRQLNTLLAGKSGEFEERHGGNGQALYAFA